MKHALSIALLLVVAAGAAAAAAPPQPDYHPSMGDLMTLAVQPRHTKLGLAGQAHNWTYAAYESGELRHAFDRVAKTIPVYRDNDMAGAAQQNMKAPLDALDAAIKARNPAAFTLAYGKVTKGCNACHQSLSHPEVVIKSPAAGAYPDQDFRPRATK
jgi:cytochrome c556